jgi:hypothetical protein
VWKELKKIRATSFKVNEFSIKVKQRQDSRD